MDGTRAAAALTNGGSSSRADAADGADEDEVGGGVVYRVQLDDEADEYARVSDAIAAMEAGEDDELLELEERHQQLCHPRQQRLEDETRQEAAGRDVGAVSEYEQLRKRAQHEFEQLTEQVTRAVASGDKSDTGVTQHSDVAAPTTAFSPLHSSATSSPRSEPSFIAPTLAASNTSTAAASPSVPSPAPRSLSSLSSVPLSAWLSTGRPLPLRSAGDAAWQRELECQSVAAGAAGAEAEREAEEEQEAEQTTVDGPMGDALAKCANYRTALDTLAGPVPVQHAPLTAHSNDRSALEAALRGLRQQQQQQQPYRKVTARPSHLCSSGSMVRGLVLAAAVETLMPFCLPVFCVVRRTADWWAATRFVRCLLAQRRRRRAPRVVPRAVPVRPVRVAAAARPSAEPAGCAAAVRPAPGAV